VFVMIALRSNRLANQAGGLPSRKSSLLELQRAPFSPPFSLNTASLKVSVVHRITIEKRAAEERRTGACFSRGHRRPPN
jgi:hypothetical protein